MRTIAFITTLFLSTLLPLPLVMIMFIAYAALWDGYELVVIAVLIDAYFGASQSLPYYTLATFMLLIVMVWAKPKLLVYNR